MKSAVVYILSTCFLVPLSLCRKGAISVEASLIEFLFVDSNYSTAVRPVHDETTPTNLTISVNQFGLLSMDPSEETVKFSVEFLLRWRDPFLTWDLKDFNVTYIKVKEINIWKPDVVISSSIDSTVLLELNERYADLKYDGQVLQSMHGIYANLCKMKVDKFPYDTQICEIDIGPWSYRREQIRVYAEDPNLNGTGYYMGNSEWELITFNTSIHEETDNDINFTYQEAGFFIAFKRRPQFYVWVLLIPTLIITVVALFGLFVPTNTLGEREERVNLGLTTLLSNAVILEIVAGTMPKTSSLPMLGDFILAEIFVTALGVFFSVVILTLHNRALTRNWPCPKWIRIFLRFPRVKRKNKKLTMRWTKVDVQEETSESGILGDISSCLNRVQEWIMDEEHEKKRELLWTRFFDRVDILLLFIFQIGNIIVTAMLI